MEPLNLTNVFFEALKYPEYARPNFYIRKQKESGWSKGVYLTTLSEVYHACVMRFEIKHSAQKRKTPNLTIDQIHIPLKEFTDGEELEDINKEQIDQLDLAVQASWYFESHERKFSAIEVLSFSEYALWFILNEFKIQANEIQYPFFRPRTKTYFIYLISQDSPFFDYPKFKIAIRELLLTSENLDNLKIILTKYHRAAKEIVELWNSKIFAIVNRADGDIHTNLAETVRVQFKGETLKHSWWNNVPLFEIMPHNLFTNQDLAYYAANIVNLLANEVLNDKSEDIKVSEKDFVRDFIEGIHQLQTIDIGAECIKNIKEGNNWEHPFRDWFASYFGGQKYVVDRESLKGSGHIDLKVSHISFGNKIVEFKGWWNADRKMIIDQVCKYLTSFEGDGYIFTINHEKSDIAENYKSIITDAETGYKDGTWDEIPFSPTAFRYFKSKHQKGSEPKVIYHFIFSVY